MARMGGQNSTGPAHLTLLLLKALQDMKDDNNLGTFRVEFEKLYKVLHG